jgi:hypothetical protein
MSVKSEEENLEDAHKVEDHICECKLFFPRTFAADCLCLF